MNIKIFVQIMLLGCSIYWIGPIIAVAQFMDQSHLFHGTYSENYVNRWAFQKMCHHTFDQRTNEFMWPTSSHGVTLDPKAVKAGDIIFVRDAPVFFKKIHPHITQPYIMVTAGEYRDTVLETSLDYLDAPTIIAWFSVHACERCHPKFHQIPLGIYQDKRYYKPRAKLTQLFAQWRHAPKKRMMYSNYGDIRGKKKERADVNELFDNAPYNYKAKRLPFMDYMKEMSEFKFTLSPRGYGPDSYRNYEAMLVGSIPIVHTSHLDPLYADLPVLIVQEWEEINEEFLEQKYKEMTTKKFNIEKLFMEYWWTKIENVRQEFLANMHNSRA